MSLQATGLQVGEQGEDGTAGIRGVSFLARITVLKPFFPPEAVEKYYRGRW